MDQLQKVFDSILLARILYAAPAWRGYLSTADTQLLQQHVDKAFRWKISNKKYIIEEIFDKCDFKLFKASLDETHCINHLYPAKKDHKHAMSLRPRGHNFPLPKLKYQSARMSFINRSLYKYV